MVNQMKQLWNSFATNQYSFYLLTCVVCLLFMPEMALADSPFDVSKILPASLKDKSFFVQIISILAITILGLIVIVMGFGGSNLIAELFQSLSEARRMGDWGSFFRTLGIVLVVLIAAILIATFLFNALSKVELKPTVTVG